MPLVYFFRDCLWTTSADLNIDLTVKSQNLNSQAELFRTRRQVVLRPRVHGEDEERDGLRGLRGPFVPRRSDILGVG